MNQKFTRSATALALGVALTGSTFMMEAYALTSPTEGYVELGHNEDDDGDQDIWDSKAGRWDPRANILGVFPSDDSCVNHYNPTDNGSSKTEECAFGPDYGDLFETVAGEVVYKDAITAGSPPTAGSNGIPDYLDYGGISAAHVADGVVSYNGDTTTFAGSNKNNHPIDTYQWKTGSVPPKDDVSNAYFYALQGTIGDHLNHLLITGGFERISNDGDSHIDIEFNQSAIGLTADGGSTVWYPTDTTPQPTCGGGKGCVFVGERTHNDILVSMDFEKGGDFGILTIHRWDDKGTPTDTSDDEWVIAVETGGEGCNEAYDPDGGGGPLPEVPADAVCAYNNNGEIDPGDWTTFDRHGAPLASGGKLPRNAFTEGAMDVNYLLGLAETQSPPCISSVTVKTRSSSSFTATLKDFALGAFEVCGSVTVVKEATGAVGDPVFSYTTDLGDNFTLSPHITTAGVMASANTVFNNVMPGTYDITEANAAGFASNATVTCEYAGGGTVPADSYDFDSVVNLQVQIGEAITCTFSNAQPQLTVRKAVNSCGTDTGSFNLFIDPGPGEITATGGDGTSTGSHYVAVGVHTVSETADNGTSLSDYYSFVDDTPTKECTAGPVAATSLTFTLADSNDSRDCTFTNVRRPTVTVVKQTIDAITGSTITDPGHTLVGAGVVGGTPTLDTGVWYFPAPTVGETFTTATDKHLYSTIISCSDGKTAAFAAGASETRTTALTGSEKTGYMQAGQDIFCRVINVKKDSWACTQP